MNESIMLLPEGEQALRLKKVRSLMRRAGVDALLVQTYANIYYLTGRVFTGYILISPDGEPTYYVKRPVSLSGDTLVSIRKPEQIELPEGLQKIALELGSVSFAQAERLRKALGVNEVTDGSDFLARSRAVKTPYEIKQIVTSGIKQERVYRKIPELYHEGMTDIELQIEIERLSRLEGCLGLFRTGGDSMELFMANVLSGKNADTPTPYDFAMGGRGLDASIPVGADGSILRKGDAVMVDANGNYTGYMTDMTRTFAVSHISDLAERAHKVSIEICRRAEELGQPGTEASEIYHMAENMAHQAGLGEYFMGHRQKAGFVGHGLGIEINELPVISPRSTYQLCEGNVVALEPKFVIPDAGAVGIENTYVVYPEGLRCVTKAPEEIIILE